jgi:hypothetical protein
MSNLIARYGLTVLFAVAFLVTLICAIGQRSETAKARTALVDIEALHDTQINTIQAASAADLEAATSTLKAQIAKLQEAAPSAEIRSAATLVFKSKPAEGTAAPNPNDAGHRVDNREPCPTSISRGDVEEIPCVLYAGQPAQMSITEARLQTENGRTGVLAEGEFWRLTDPPARIYKSTLDFDATDLRGTAEEAGGKAPAPPKWAASLGGGPNRDGWTIDGTIERRLKGRVWGVAGLGIDKDRASDQGRWWYASARLRAEW